MEEKNKKKVAEYIKRNCATYDKDGLCLLETDSNGGRLCPLIYELGKTCKYAETSVLPADPDIEALYNAGKQGAIGDTCERCNKPYKRTSNRQKRCRACAQEVRRNKRIQYNAKYRKGRI